jgi:hypothetical protein
MKSRFYQSKQRGVALLLALSVLSMILVLVVGYATLTRTDSMSAGNYRDYVGSRYMAQGAMNRAMAEIAVRYATNSGTSDKGLSTIYSTVATNTADISNATAIITSGTAAQQLFATDIEKITTNSSSGNVYAKQGKDETVDYIPLPGASSNNVAQWIGIKGTNGILVGRMAFIITSGGININAIGNNLSHSDTTYGPSFNSRNQGISVSELNLPAALMAINDDPTTGWGNYATATNNASVIIDYRKGPDVKAGTSITDDNNNGGFAETDRIDNDGDGTIDEVGEGLDEPQEHLAYSDETDKSSIYIPVGVDDKTITDIKQLYNGTVDGSHPDFNAGGVFQQNFTDIQKTFTTESSVAVPPSSVWLNNTNTALETQAQLYNKVLGVLQTTSPFSTNTALELAQLAANVVTYGSTNVYPYSTTVSGTEVVGVSTVPYINQVVYQLVWRVYASRTLASGVPRTNVYSRLNITPHVEIWYPYTNAYELSSYIQMTNSIIRNNNAAGTSWLTDRFWGLGASAVATIPGTALGAPEIINSSHFQTFTGPLKMVRDNSQDSNLANDDDWTWINPHSNTSYDRIFKDLTHKVWISNDTGVLDISPTFSTNILLTFTTNETLQLAWSSLSTAALPTGSGPAQSITNYLSFALNDPRVKRWKIEYFGPAIAGKNLITDYCSLGTTNFSATVPSSLVNTSDPLFRPDLGEDRDYDTAGLPKGIAPTTFYVKQQRRFSSVAELGRVHRGQDWKTIDFKSHGTDGNLLDKFTIYNPYDPITGLPTYVHGKVNINSKADDEPVWAALFAGMPVQSQKSADAGAPIHYLDINGSREIDPALTKSKKLGRVIGSKAGTYSHMGALLSIGELSNLSTNNSVFNGNPFNNMTTDADREYMINHIANLVSTEGQGNTFLIWAWGQTLRGPPTKKNPSSADIIAVNSRRYPTAETLIVAMVTPDIDTSAGRKLRLKVIYFRYNPDLELMN